MLPINETYHCIKKNNVSGESIYKKNIFIIIICRFYHKSKVDKCAWRIFRTSYITKPKEVLISQIPQRVKINKDFNKALADHNSVIINKSFKVFLHKADKNIIKEYEGVNYVCVRWCLGTKEETKIIVFERRQSGDPLKYEKLKNFVDINKESLRTEDISLWTDSESLIYSIYLYNQENINKKTTSSEFEL